MPKKLILFPFGGNAREALMAVLDINKTTKEWDVLGFIDDDPKTWGGQRSMALRFWGAVRS